MGAYVLQIENKNEGSSVDGESSEQNKKTNKSDQTKCKSSAVG